MSLGISSVLSPFSVTVVVVSLTRCRPATNLDEPGNKSPSRTTKRWNGETLPRRTPKPNNVRVRYRPKSQSDPFILQDTNTRSTLSQCIIPLPNATPAAPFRRPPLILAHFSKPPSRMNTTPDDQPKIPYHHLKVSIHPSQPHLTTTLFLTLPKLPAVSTPPFFSATTTTTTSSSPTSFRPSTSNPSRRDNPSAAVQAAPQLAPTTKLSSASTEPSPPREERRARASRVHRHLQRCRWRTASFARSDETGFFNCQLRSHHQRDAALSGRNHAKPCRETVLRNRPLGIPPKSLTRSATRESEASGNLKAPKGPEPCGRSSWETLVRRLPSPLTDNSHLAQALQRKGQGKRQAATNPATRDPTKLSHPEKARLEGPQPNLS